MASPLTEDTSQRFPAGDHGRGVLNRKEPSLTAGEILTFPAHSPYRPKIGNLILVFCQNLVDDLQS